MGDRVFTDVVMTNRMRREMRLDNSTRASTLQSTELTGQGSEASQPNGPLAIWTSAVWEKEAMGMRFLEKKLVEIVQRWTKDAKEDDGPDMTRFVREGVELEPLSTDMMARLFRRFRIRTV